MDDIVHAIEKWLRNGDYILGVIKGDFTWAIMGQNTMNLGVLLIVIENQETITRMIRAIIRSDKK